MASYFEACKCPEKKDPNKKVNKKNNKSNSQKTSKGSNGAAGKKGKEDAKKGNEVPKKEPYKYPCITGKCGKTGKKGNPTKK
jgi:hypothetical protein